MRWRRRAAGSSDSTGGGQVRGATLIVMMMTSSHSSGAAEMDTVHTQAAQHGARVVPAALGASCVRGGTRIAHGIGAPQTCTRGDADG